MTGSAAADVTLHEVRRPDGEQVAQVTALLGDLVAGGAALGWTQPPTTEQIRALLDDVSDDPAEACGLVARRAGRVVGLGYWRRYRRPTYRPHADLEKLAVAPDLAGRGIGTALLAGLIDAARRQTRTIRNEAQAHQQEARHACRRDGSAFPGAADP